MPTIFHVTFMTKRVTDQSVPQYKHNKTAMYCTPHLSEAQFAQLVEDEVPALYSLSPPLAPSLCQLGPR
jgi:hypothetical protein